MHKSIIAGPKYRQVEKSANKEISKKKNNCPRIRMQNLAMKSWKDSSWLNGENQSYIENLYEKFLQNPQAVDKIWRIVFQQIRGVIVENPSYHSIIREYFRQLGRESKKSTPIKIDHNINFKQIKVLHLINAFRFFGHQNANIDPLFLLNKEVVPELELSYHDLNMDDFEQKFNVGFFASENNVMRLADLYSLLQKTYCSNIGAEYMHINNIEEKTWIQKRLESLINRTNFNIDEKKIFMQELAAAEGLEKYLSTKFPGAKRFSLEGGDSLIPMLREIIRHTTKIGISEVVFGMAHRGRLNVLVNVLGKRPKDLFNEFAGRHKENFGTGDVKYHMGFSSNIEIEGKIVHLSLAFNPSHLEIISPVVMGCVRARLDQLANSNIITGQVLPVTIHGDSAIIGQGVVQETLNMSQARGYEVGGTIRIVINNQIGFTTSNPKDVRSTTYCTDIGKMLLSPIFHVNADDLESVIFVTRLALDYRQIFKKDIFIDLVCYRRHGHNEADEPNATQPIMYQKISKHPTTLKIYSEKLQNEGIISVEDSLKINSYYRDNLDKGECMVSEWRPMSSYCFPRSLCLNRELEEKNLTSVKLERLKELALSISRIPETFIMQSRVAKIYNNRKEMAKGKQLFDWGAAENLAYATLLDEGISIRLSGEDSSRGTFFHRHTVIHNQSNGETYTPLQHISSKQGKFNVWDSVLSEEAVLAFEYGYAIAEPRVLTIWEAQFGDFANGAQIVIDQFISSGEQKWGQMCGLIMLLPHGYEGQGPEHSSARLERYLQLCAEENIQVCVPSTPSQIYHMIRRQALRKIQRPLIVMSPKSLLRHHLAKSSLKDLAKGYFYEVIDETDNLDPLKVERVVLCSGKVYYDLLEQRRKNQQINVAIIRIEQLYPFPYESLKNILKNYSHIQDFIWCQEEPLNQGAWYCSQHYFREVIPCCASLRYEGRPASASPAVGYISLHQQQQQSLINNALNFDPN